VFHVKHLQLSEDQIPRFQKVCSSLGIELSEIAFERFQTYLNQILDWNKRIHLVSKGDAQTERILRHFVDSLTIFKAVQIPSGANLLDIGAGAGFPSIPIKIVRNDINLSLVESVRKKSLFLQKLVNDLKLEDVSVINKRAEDLIDASDYKEKFDIVTVKALGKLKDAVELATSFLKPKGLLIAYKGERVEEEISAIGRSAFGGKEIKEKNFSVKKKILIRISDFDLKRTMVVMEKIRSTGLSTDETD
jgi:16S rRNA (guanine527-N7)-methyltransferase